MRALFKSFFANKRDREMVLYVHFPCFDGVASAVLAKAILEIGSNLVVRKVLPVTYDVRSRWLSTRLEKHAVVVDFLFHPDAEYWADHHKTTFLNESAVQVFRSHSGREKWLYEPTARSCSSVIWNSCGSVLPEPQLFQELVKWADKIDSAAYSSVHEAIFGDDPALRINRSLLVNADARYCEFLVGSISRKGLSSTAKSRNVTLRANRALKLLLRGLQMAERTVKLEGDVVVLRTDETVNNIVSRYTPYLFFPDARYSIMSSHSAGVTKITAMRNPWIQFESIPLGPLFARFGGGGHDRVASVELPDDPLSADHILANVLQALQGQQTFHDRESIFA